MFVTEHRNTTNNWNITENSPLHYWTHQRLMQIQNVRNSNGEN